MSVFTLAIVEILLFGDLPEPLPRLIEALAPIGNVVLVAVLAIVTWWYARSTEKIAKATQLQASQAFRPVLTIEGDGYNGIYRGERIDNAVQAATECPENLPFNIRNVGVGPALNVSWAKGPKAEVANGFEHLAVLAKDGEPIRCELGVVEENGIHRVSVSYKDVSGQAWRSFRDVAISRERSDLMEGEDLGIGRIVVGELKVETIPPVLT